jgi:hypothetical protein
MVASIVAGQPDGLAAAYDRYANRDGRADGRAVLSPPAGTVEGGRG